jgi:hypothetical protein
MERPDQADHAATGHAAPAAGGQLAVANELFLLVPSCLMTLAPVTPLDSSGVTRAEVEDILAQCGARFQFMPASELASQLKATGSDLKGRVEFAYVGIVENYEPFAIAGSDFAFISVIGCSDPAAAGRAGERMARHERTVTSSRGFACANVIVQRIAADGMNADRLDRFLLERFAAVASH